VGTDCHSQEGTRTHPGPEQPHTLLENKQISFQTGSADKGNSRLLCVASTGVILVSRGRRRAGHTSSSLLHTGPGASIGAFDANFIEPRELLFPNHPIDLIQVLAAFEAKI